MPVKIRLARHGRKRRAFYYIVAADSRAPRDGRYIERIGSYNPNTDPATIDLNFDKAVGWLQNGAVPTDTCRAILSYKGVLYKNHLLKGITKGALTEEEAENKFNTWMKDKEQKIQAKVDNLKNKSKADKESRLKIEEEINNARAEELAAKQIPVTEEEVEQAEEIVAEETVTEKVNAEDVVTEKPAAEKVEAETKDVEEKTEDVKAEAKEVVEEKSEEKKED
ncbi:MAG: 30S ribosomal protein S16 [Bacteroidetes bacterium]|nr:MAG: 30S ribosomal protein S16 [Bacteroidota bacterium]